jgi:MFS family permease
MGALLVGLVTGVVFPTLMMMLRRHYEARPNQWEPIFVTAGFGVAALAGGVWGFTVNAFDDDSLGRFAVVVLAGWTIIFGLGALSIAISEAASAVKETRKD